MAALEALWALHGCVGLDEATAEALLEHPDADVRAWCVRLVGDEPDVSSRLAARLAEIATREPDVTSPLATRLHGPATCCRATGSKWPSACWCATWMAMTLTFPLLLWWAVERHALVDLEDTLARFTSPAAWRSAMVRSTILGRLVRRLAAEKNAAGDAACARVIASAPSDRGAAAASGRAGSGAA